LSRHFHIALIIVHALNIPPSWIFLTIIMKLMASVRHSDLKKSRVNLVRMFGSHIHCS